MLTAYENIQFILQIQGVREHEQRERIMPLLESLGMKGLENRFPTQLSGGQQQMLAIGRALMANPSLILLDEPSEGLSPVLIDGLVGALNTIRQAGTGVLVV